MKIRFRQEPVEAPKVDPYSPNYPKTREYLDSMWGEINRYHIKTMPDQRQWVIHCVTGEVLERKDAQPIQDRRGNVMWIGIREKLSQLDRPNVQSWKNPNRNTF